MTAVQLFEASTSYQVMVLAAALDAGCFAPADERVLLVSVNAPVPEEAGRPDEAPGIAPLLRRFDRVVSLNDLLDPVHPTAFRPRPSEQPLFERLLRRAAGVAEDAAVELVLESVQAAPARSLLMVFGGASATVYAEGLMSYGPTREPLPPHAASRIRRVLHLDLVPGLRPLLLDEHGVRSEAIPDRAFRAVVAEVAAAASPSAPAGPYALVIGQYLARLGLLTVAQETALVAEQVRLAAGRGFGTVAVKPHPSAPAGVMAAVARAVPEVELVVLDDPVPVEALYATRPPGLVLGCFSTGLVTAGRFWDVPALTVGTPRVLAALPRFEDSNRVPLAIVGRVVPGPGGPAPADDGVALQRFVETLGYCMQWRTRARSRTEALAALAADPAPYAHVVPRSRLRLLGLPGGWPIAVPARLFERARGPAERAWRLRTAVARRLRA